MPIDWNTLAQRLAKRSHERLFRHRWGVRWLSRRRAWCLFNNTPYRGEMLRRERELEEIRRAVAMRGVEELGYATYPVGGPDDGYSYAMLLRGPIDCAADLEALVLEVMARVAREWPDPGVARPESDQ